MVNTLIAYGPNQVSIPCRFFETLDKGKEFLKSLNTRFPDATTLNTKGTELDIEDDKESIIGHEVFKSYYGGCGEIYSYGLKAVPYDSVFLTFSLD